MTTLQEYAETMIVQSDVDDAHTAFVRGKIDEDEFARRLRGIGFDEDELSDWLAAAWEDRRDWEFDNGPWGVGS